MKEKILPFIIGILVGAIVASLGYCIYSKLNSKPKGMREQNRPAIMQQDGNSSDETTTPPERPLDNGENGNGPQGRKQNKSNSDTTQNSTNTENTTNTI